MKKPQKKPTEKTESKLLFPHLPWGGLTSIGLVIVSYFLSYVVVGGLYTLYASLIKHWSANQANTWLNNSVVGQFVYGIIIYAAWLGMFFLSMLVYGYLNQKGSYYLKKWRDIFNTVGWRKPRWRDIPYALSGFGLYFVVLVAVIAVLRRIFAGFNASQAQNVGYSGTTHGPALILVFISLVLIPPFVEETIFRGFLFTGLKKSLPIIWAGVFTSLLFAIPHLFEGVNGTILAVGGVDTFILSLVLVYLRQQTGSLWSCVGLHMLKNFVAFVSLFFFAHIIL